MSRTVDFNFMIIISDIHFTVELLKEQFLAWKI